MFGKKSKPIDLQEDKARKDAELAALEASLDFLKRPAVKDADKDDEEGENKNEIVTAADRARAMKFGRRMDYKTAVVKRGENNQESENSDNEEAAKAEDSVTEEETLQPDSIPEKKQEEKEEITPETVDNTEDRTDSEQDEKKEEEKSKGIVIAEAPVPDTGEEETPKLIDNPLPTPKKHVPKEMDFDLEPDPDHMHFDVVDMKGKDYFDI